MKRRRGCQGEARARAKRTDTRNTSSRTLHMRSGEMSQSMMSSRVSGGNTYLRRAFRSAGHLLSGSILGVGGWEVGR